MTAAADVSEAPNEQRRVHWRPGVVQDVAPAGVDDLAPGYLDPSLLPVGLLREAAADALSEYGAAALSYGDNQGALHLRSLLARRSSTEAAPCGPQNVLLTAGTSHALYLIATMLAAPGDVVLIDELSYDLAQRLFTDCGLLLRRIGADGEGTGAPALDEAIGAVRREGRSPAFIYLTPTFHNPTGRTLSESRRAELLAVAAAHAVLVVEDDAYAELLLDPGAPVTPMASMAGHQGVLRLRTFAKTLAPGLRLGWLLGAPELVQRLVSHGMFVSGGSVNHTVSMMVASLLQGGGYDRHLRVLRAELKQRRDALTGALDAFGSGLWERSDPAGGFFLWLRFQGEVMEKQLLAVAEKSRVRVAPGSRFGVTPDAAIRLSYSFNPPGLLGRAGHRLAADWLGSARPDPRIGSFREDR